MKFADVIIPLPLEGVFTYTIPNDLENNIQIGQRVVVPFGGKKLYTAIVEKIHSQAPTLYKTKEIYSILEDFSMVTEEQISFWKWISEYYMCSLGDVYRNSFPSALKLESETFIKKAPLDINWNDLNDKETFIMQNLEIKTSINLKEIETFISKKYIIPTVKSLYEKHLIELDEQIIEKYKAKKISYVKLSSNFENDQIFKEALIEVNKAPKQREALLQLIQLQQKSSSPITKKELIEKSSPSAIKNLIEKNYIVEFQIQKDRIELYDDHIEDAKKLSENQKKAFDEIIENFKKYSTVLLHGITGSGKTEIYFHLIEEQIKNSKNSLFLLPEISITTQLLEKIKKRYGDYVGVYHSKLNANERVEIWKNTLNNKYKIIIGARSSIFLPLQNLGLIIVDEEHDSSYKQSDNPPFYNARDCVQILAQQQKASVLLGSATPSMESFYNHELNKFGLVELNERFGKINLPQIQMVDLKKSSATSHISQELQEEINYCLENKKQAIIFHNRRGFAPIIECNHCGHSPNCPNCDVSLTYHKVSGNMRCHYCGYAMAIPQFCPSCHSHSLETKGIGTQQIEEEIKILFPNARIARMDVDTMKRKHAFEILFEKMTLHEIDILIGTQMVTKGLDFDAVHLVGVIRSDSLMNVPTFRAEERAIQLLTQVSGRAGRKEEGKVIIQSFDIENPLYFFIKENNYKLIKEAVLKDRQDFFYPPYYRLIEITCKYKNQERVKKVAEYMGDYLKNYIQEPFILGPEEGIIPRINNQYIYKILIKHPSGKSTKNIKIYIKNALQNIMQIQAYKSVKINVDVDPN